MFDLNTVKLGFLTFLNFSSALKMTNILSWQRTQACKNILYAEKLYMREESRKKTLQKEKLYKKQFEHKIKFSKVKHSNGE